MQIENFSFKLSKPKHCRAGIEIKELDKSIRFTCVICKAEFTLRKSKAGNLSDDGSPSDIQERLEEMKPMDSEMKEDTTVVAKSGLKNFSHKTFFAKKGESKEDLISRFEASFGNIADFEISESSEFPHGVALVRKRKEGKQPKVLGQVKGLINPKAEDPKTDKSSKETPI